jgi:hypothetical protein
MFACGVLIYVASTAVGNRAKVILAFQRRPQSPWPKQVFQVRHCELEDQQRAANGKDGITECFDPLQFLVRIHVVGANASQSFDPFLSVLFVLPLHCVWVGHRDDVKFSATQSNEHWAV